MAFEFRLQTVKDMTPDLWAACTALRNRETAFDDPFFDPEFARLLGEVRDDTRIGIALDHGDMVGFWAMHVRPGEWSRPIGGPFSNWHGPVVSSSSSLSPECFLRGLGLAGFSAFAMPGALATTWSGRPHDVAYLTDLSAGWSAFSLDLERQWGSHFKKMRRLRRAAIRKDGEVEFRFEDNTEQTFTQLIHLKRDQLARTGRHDVFAPDWSRALLDRLRTHESPRLRTRLVSIYIGGQHAASELNLMSDKVMNGWLAGFDRGYARWSPGHLLVEDLLQHLSEHGPYIYDAGAGSAHYKRQYSNLQRPVMSGTLRGDRPLWHPARAFGQMWSYGERIMPAPVADTLTRVRQRLDQICLTETTLRDRAAGIAGAVRGVATG